MFQSYAKYLVRGKSRMNYKEKGQNRILRFALFDIVVRVDLLNQSVTFKYFVNGFQRMIELFNRVSGHQ